MSPPLCSSAAKEVPLAPFHRLAPSRVVTRSYSSRLPPPLPASRHIRSIQADMSVNDFFDSLLTKTTTEDEDKDLFRQYLNLDEYDYNCSNLHPTNQPLPLVMPSDPLPPVVHPTVPSSKVYSSTSHPGRSVTAQFIPIAPSTPPAPAVTDTLPVLHYVPTDNSTCDFRALHRVCWRARLNDSVPLAGASTCSSSDVPRPIGLGTTSTYWNTRAATYSGEHGTVDMASPYLGGRTCIATVSS